jgi:hypothetical protein
MNALTLTLIRVAFLAVLWLFVIAAIGVVRTDLLGTVVAKVRRGRNQPAPMQQPKGRANDATLVLNDDYASTYHARIFPQDGQWLVEDLGSTNGTYLDRQKVARPTPVPVGVPIRIGKTVLELRR